MFFRGFWGGFGFCLFVCSFVFPGKNSKEDWFVGEELLIRTMKGELVVLAVFRGSKTCFFLYQMSLT